MAARGRETARGLDGKTAVGGERVSELKGRGFLMQLPRGALRSDEICTECTYKGEMLTRVAKLESSLKR
jgi:hypothetical protein